MARGLLKTLVWMLAVTTTSITDVFTVIGLLTLPALALSFPLGVFIPALAGLAGVAVYLGGAQGRKKFTEGYNPHRDEETGEFTREDLAALATYSNISILLAGAAGGAIAGVVPGVGLAVAAAYPAVDMAVGSRRWYLSPASLLTTALLAAGGHGVELATLLQAFHDSNQPLLQRIRPRKGA